MRKRTANLELNQSLVSCQTECYRVEIPQEEEEGAAEERRLQMDCKRANEDKEGSGWSDLSAALPAPQQECLTLPSTAAIAAKSSVRTL